jgi:hypothetical protein
MTMSRRDRSDPREEILLRFLRDLPLAVIELEKAVGELLESSWEEPFRRRALELSSTLAAASARMRLSHVASVAKAIASLLRISPEEALPIREALRDKLRELLGLLKDVRLDSEESA